jgi:hypothetical protein
MPHYAGHVRSLADKRSASLSEAGPQRRQNGPQRSALWRVLQLKAAQAQAETPAPPSPNRSGLPAQLKAGVENLSGIAMEDVRVHRDSPEPAKLGALAYTQGSEIHLGPGQEQHLPHEAWHVVQQKQGRVQATTQMKGAALNEDGGLEREADAMGARAMAAGAQLPRPALDAIAASASPIQKMSVKGNAVASTVSADTHSKHVVATNDQAAAAKANEGSTTFVTSDALITAAVDANNYNFTMTPSAYRNIYANVVCSRYDKSVNNKQGAGEAVAIAINAQATNCQIGVQKTRARKLKVTHFKTA